MAHKYLFDAAVVKEERKEIEDNLSSEIDNNLEDFDTLKSVKKEQLGEETELQSTFEEETDSETDIIKLVKDEVDVEPEMLLAPQYNQQNLSAVRTDNVSNKIFVCDHCATTFYTKADIKRHVSHCNADSQDSIHSKTFITKCNKCKTYFINLGKQYSKGKVKCDSCKKHRERKDNNSKARRYSEDIKFKHLKVPKTKSKSSKTGISKKIKCDECGRRFPGMAKLKRHLSVHSNDKSNAKPNECDICFKTFAEKSYMIDHYNVHVANKPHKCDKCKKKFSLRASLLQHQKDHDINFKCKICSKKFTRKYNLTVHMTIHTLRKHYVCDFCQKGYVCEKTFSNHDCVKSKDSFNCSVCSKNYKLRNSLTRHLNTHAFHQKLVPITET